jgi:hypothetical protein
MNANNYDATKVIILSNMATIEQVEAPIPIYKCTKCANHFKVPLSCIETTEEVEECYHKIYRTVKYKGWTCPVCQKLNLKRADSKHWRTVNVFK